MKDDFKTQAGTIDLNTGPGAFLEPQQDLLWKKEYGINSWFAIGHFEAEGHKLNYLIHFMLMKFGDSPTLLQTCVSVTDETATLYYSEEKITPVSMAGNVSEDRMAFQTSLGSMSGDLDEMILKAHLKTCSVDVIAKGIGNVLYNAGTGYFPMLDMKVHQYSVPKMHTKGKISIDNKAYNVDGVTWFDRQWQNQPMRLAGYWSWMDLNLDNGVSISVWCVVDKNSQEKAWATILNPDGTQTVTAVVPFSKDASDFWVSEKTGQRYPTHWIVRIPEVGAVLDVTPVPREQEFISENPDLNKYEAASYIKGLYKGKEVTGFCFVELVGPWKK